MDPLVELVRGRKLLGAPAEGLVERSIAVAGSFSLDYLPPFLAVSLERLGVRARVYQAGFNAWVQELLEPGSALYAAKPEAVLLVTDLEDLFPSWYREPSLPRVEQDRLVAAQLDTVRAAAAALKRNAPSAALYLVVPALDRLPGETAAAAGGDFSGQTALESFLAGLRALAGEGVALVDWDLHARREGTTRYRDARLWYMARMRLNPPGCQALAELFARCWAARNAPRAKVVVTDLDDTLWGGLVGEEGWEKLELGHEGLGLAYRELQQELLRLRQSGLLLAVCSRNDEGPVAEAFAKHPAMALKREDFAAWRVNWKDKADNLRDIARELNVGEDSLVFLDDDAFQRAAAARVGVQVPELPKDPALRPAFVRALPSLQRGVMTAEDLKRGALYAQRARQEALRGAAASLDDFLRSLAQEAELRPVDAATLSRAAQLCQKTNQFNLTTRRHGEAELRALLSDGRHEAYTLALKDTLGDNGIVGLGILRVDGAAAEIDTLLLSCRVLGRKAEIALLAHLCARAKARGARVLVGRRLPTPKNAQTADFYARNGFAPGADPTEFRLDLERGAVPFPSEIRVVTGGSHAAAH